MKKSRIIIRVCISVVMVLLILSIQSYAQIPQTISHQGYLTDSSGTPIHGSESITFSLYATATGDTALWDQTQTVTVNQGVYSVILGGGAIPKPIDLLFDTQYWLGVKVDTDNEMIPRQALTSVPYAYRSHKGSYYLGEFCWEVRNGSGDRVGLSRVAMSDIGNNHYIFSGNSYKYFPTLPSVPPELETIMNGSGEVIDGAIRMTFNFSRIDAVEMAAGTCHGTINSLSFNSPLIAECIKHEYTYVSTSIDPYYESFTLTPVACP